MALLQFAVLASLLGLPEVSASNQVLLPLKRRPGEVMYGDTVAMRSHFVATLKVGAKGGESVQEMDVVFDTSSGQVILPSVQCKDNACQDRNLYAREVTGGEVVPDSPYGPNVDTELDMVDFDRGSIKGSFASDSFCFGPTTDFSGKSVSTCMTMHLLEAYHMADTPFLQLPFDGVIGLGLNPLSITPKFNFAGMWAASSKVTTWSQFAFYFPPSRQGPGELALGGHVASRLASPLVWVPVEEPDAGYWLVRFKAVRIGKASAYGCPSAGCYGLIDTGSSRIGVPANAYDSMASSLKISTPKDGDCRSATGAEFSFVLAGAAEAESNLVLTGGDYASLVGDRCEPEIVALREMPFEHVFVIGETLLRRYYTVFDWEKKRIGFGLSKEEKNKDEL